MKRSTKAILGALVPAAIIVIGGGIEAYIKRESTTLENDFVGAGNSDVFRVSYSTLPFACPNAKFMSYTYSRTDRTVLFYKVNLANEITPCVDKIELKAKDVDNNSTLDVKVKYFKDSKLIEETIFLNDGKGNFTERMK